MGNAFSTDPYAKAYYKSKAPTRQQRTDYAQRQLTDAKKMLGGILQGQLPTYEQLQVINFNNEGICRLTVDGSCNERKVPKQQLMALYKRKTENFIRSKQRNIVGQQHPSSQPQYKAYKKPTTVRGRTQSPVKRRR